MSENRSEYRGTLTIPGEDGPRKVSLIVDKDASSVSLRFDAPVGGAEEWSASSVKITQRMKYQEVWFRTHGLPKDGVELVWKCNASLSDDTLAGVVVARPNEQRISGEKGFTLAR